VASRTRDIVLVAGSVSTIACGRFRDGSDVIIAIDNVVATQQRCSNRYGWD
jgi:hypothetical protein